ncbi:NaCP60E, partial [Symbiodinium sp. KB8]
FAFLKAFLLDKDLATIEVSPYYEELSESKEKEQYEELPLCIIQERYQNLPGGAKFLEDLQKSQVGKKHPQSDSDHMKIYKVFKNIAISSALAEDHRNRVVGC